MSYLYICHADDKKESVERLKQHLKNQFHCWCAEGDLSSEEDPALVIPGKIRESSLVLLVLTEGANASRAIARELHVADKYSIPVVAVSIGDVSVNEAIDFYLSDTEIRNIGEEEWDPVCLSELEETIVRYVGRRSYDELINIEIETEETEETPVEEEIVAPRNEELRQRVKAILGNDTIAKEEKETDYAAIAETEELISSLLREEGVRAELSLVTEGPSFTRYIFALSEEIEEEKIDKLSPVLDEKLALSYPVDCYLSEDKSGIVMDIPLKEKHAVAFKGFLKSEGFLSTLSPTIVVGKDVNDNCIFADLKEAKILLVTGGTAEERTAFLDNAYLSLKVKFDASELTVISSENVDEAIASVKDGELTVLLLSELTETEGLFEKLSALPENVLVVVEAEASAIEDLKAYPNKIVFTRTECNCHAKYLTGEGDLIYRTDEFKVRAQMPFVSEEEGEALLTAIDAINVVAVEEEQIEEIGESEELPEEIVEETIEEESSVYEKVATEDRPDELTLRALKLCVERGEASISLLQRRPLLMNFAMASRIMAWMEEKGYVSTPDPLGYRTLLISQKDYETLYE